MGEFLSSSSDVSRRDDVEETNDAITPSELGSAEQTPPDRKSSSSDADDDIGKPQPFSLNPLARVPYPGAIRVFPPIHSNESTDRSSSPVPALSLRSIQPILPQESPPEAPRTRSAAADEQTVPVHSRSHKQKASSDASISLPSSHHPRRRTPSEESSVKLSKEQRRLHSELKESHGNLHRLIRPLGTSNEDVQPLRPSQIASSVEFAAEDSLPSSSSKQLGRTVSAWSLSPRNSSIVQPERGHASPQVSRKDSLQALRTDGVKKTGKISEDVVVVRNPIHSISSSTADTEIVYLNPLFNEPRLVPDYVIKASMPYVSCIPNKIYFDEERAEREISDCIHRYGPRRHVIIQTLIELRDSLTSIRHKNRYDKVLALVLARQGNERFILQYVKNLTVDADLFAAKAIQEFDKQKLEPDQIVDILSRITRCELRTQRRETLFRETCLSSSLCRELGCSLWGRDLKRLSESLSTRIRGIDLSLICLDRLKVIAALKTRIPSFDSIDPQEQEGIIDRELAHNAERFIAFARTILPEIYAMRTPPVFSEMMMKRREHIVRFLAKYPLESNEDPVQLSRVYISEIFCLRIINPLILSCGESTDAKKVLISLTKVVQCLAKETPFGAEKSDPIYEMLNPLFRDFFSMHCEFIDQNSLKKPL
ncbi:MAG: hypothetical protein JSS60_03600 [Verrucomicrobia bacterium]|nr:hypothetical protein [Verrucomicrobiota bacterium]